MLNTKNFRTYAAPKTKPKIEKVKAYFYEMVSLKKALNTPFYKVFGLYSKTFEFPYTKMVNRM